MTGQLFNIIAPILVSVGLGFWWAKSQREWDTEFVTTLTYFIGTPCLVFSTLTTTPLEASAFFSMAGAALAALLGFIGMGVSALLAKKLAIRKYLPLLMFPNAGNMGLPLCFFAFGDHGLALGIAYFTVTSISNFTLGVWINAGTTSPGELLKTPLIYAIAFALGIITLGIEVPLWIANTTSLIGGLTIPMILITLGVSLARLEVKNLGRAIDLSVLRLILGFGCGITVAEVFGFQGLERGIVILQSSMPVAVFAYLFAQRYNNSPEDAAGTVVVSTTMSFLVLPILLIYTL